jgi:hypothetical protein
VLTRGWDRVDVIPEAPFVFSIAALSASLAGLAGLVAGLRRGVDVRPIDLFRLRQIVEFAFANVLLAVGTIPLTTQFGVANGVRLAAVAALVYAAGSSLVLLRRMRTARLDWSGGWRSTATGLSAVLLVAAGWAIWSGSVVAWQSLLIVLLARPMLAFLLVLASFDG